MIKLFIFLLSSLSAEGKNEFFLLQLAFATLLLLIGYFPGLKRYIQQHVFHKQKNMHEPE
jgi:hypothetical protein